MAQTTPWVSVLQVLTCLFAGAAAQTITTANLAAAIDSWIANPAASGYGLISSWDVANVTDMATAFSRYPLFDEDLSLWDVSSVTTMAGMFNDAAAFNGDLSRWDVSGVTDLSNMFNGTTAFHGNISQWTVSAAADVSGMFYGTGFNGDLSLWDVSAVTNMDQMFRTATSFNGGLSLWDVSSVTSLDRVFAGAAAFKGAIGSWDVSNVSNMLSAFDKARKFNGDLSAWDVSSVTTMQRAFADSDEFNGVLGSWDVSSVTNMLSMFDSAGWFDRDLAEWDVSSVTTIAHLLAYTNVSYGNLSLWDVSSVTDVASLLHGVKPFNGDLSTWDVSAVTTTANAFDGAEAFNGDIARWDVSSLTTAQAMFYFAKAFNGDVSLWDVSALRDLTAMFNNADAFNGDLSRWDVSAALTMDYMFDGADLFFQDLSHWTPCRVNETFSFCTYGCTPPNLPCSFAPTVAPSAAPSHSPTDAPTTTATPSTTPAPTDTSNTAVDTRWTNQGTQTIQLGGVYVTVSEDAAWGEGGLLKVTRGGQSLPPNGISEVVSIDLDVNGSISSVTSLGTPVLITLPLLRTSASFYDECERQRIVRRTKVPACVSRITGSDDAFTLTGCTVHSVTAATVVCACTHLTDFMAVGNTPTSQDVRNLNSIFDYPTPFITLCVVFVFFLGASVAAGVVDRRKDALAEVKRKKWECEARFNIKKDLAQSLKSALQHSHPWFSVLFRPTGSNFRSVDRCLCLLVFMLLNMCITAAAWQPYVQKDRDILDRVINDWDLVLQSIFASCVAAISREILEQVFSRVGPLGFREAWQREQGPAPQTRLGRCAHVRLPIWVGSAVRLLCLASTPFLSVAVLLFGLQFDLNARFFCNNAQGARSWILTFCVSTLAQAVLVAPAWIVFKETVRFQLRQRRAGQQVVQLVKAQSDDASED